VLFSGLLEENNAFETLAASLNGAVKEKRKIVDEVTLKK